MKLMAIVLRVSYMLDSIYNVNWIAQNFYWYCYMLLLWLL